MPKRLLLEETKQALERYFDKTGEFAMIHEICFYVKGSMVEVNAQDFLLGELTESCLNI